MERYQVVRSCQPGLMMHSHNVIKLVSFFTDIQNANYHYGHSMPRLSARRNYFPILVSPSFSSLLGNLFHAFITLTSITE